MIDPTANPMSPLNLDEVELVTLIFGSGIAGGSLSCGRPRDELFEPGKFIFNLRGAGSASFPEALVANHLLASRAMIATMRHQLQLPPNDRWDMRTFGEVYELLSALPNPAMEVLEPLERGYRILGERIGDLLAAHVQLLRERCTHIVLGGGPLQSQYVQIRDAARERCRFYGLELQLLPQEILAVQLGKKSPWKTELQQALSANTLVSERELFEHLLQVLQRLVSSNGLHTDYLPVSAYRLLMETLAESGRCSKLLPVEFDGEIELQIPWPQDLRPEDVDSLLLGKFLSALLVNRVVTLSFQESNITEARLPQTLAELGVAEEILQAVQPIPERAGMGLLSGPYHRTNLACRAMDSTPKPSTTLGEMLSWFDEDGPRWFPGIDLGASAAKLVLLKLERGRIAYLPSPVGHLIETVPLRDLLEPGQTTVQQFADRLVALFARLFLREHETAPLADWGMAWPGPVSRAGRICGASAVLGHFPGQTRMIADATPEQVGSFPLRESLQTAWRNFTGQPTAEVHLLNDGQAAAFGSFARLWNVTDIPEDEHVWRYSLGAYGAALNAACGFVGNQHSSAAGS